MFVGIDVSKKTLDVFVRPRGERFAVTNDEPGWASLAARCLDVKADIVVFESTGGYERDASHVLMGAGLNVAVVNAAQVRAFGKALGVLAKTDSIDAEVIAHFAEAVKPRLSVRLDDEMLETQALLVRRRQLVDMRTMEKARLLQGKGVIRARIEAHIGYLNEQIKDAEDDIDKFLRERLSEQEKLLATIPGFGDVSRRTLLLDVPELGTLNRKQVAALVGLAPFNVDSGLQRGQRHIRGGRSEPRAVLFMAAMSAVRGKSPFADFYRRLRAAGKNPKAAIIAVARKMLVVANAVLRTCKAWVAPTPST